MWKHCKIVKNKLIKKDIMVTLKQTGPNEYKSFKYEVNIKKDI